MTAKIAKVLFIDSQEPCETRYNKIHAQLPDSENLVYISVSLEGVSSKTKPVSSIVLSKEKAIEFANDLLKILHED
jgi:hypothetical protein